MKRLILILGLVVGASAQDYPVVNGAPQMHFEPAVALQLNATVSTAVDRVMSTTTIDTATSVNPAGTERAIYMSGGWTDNAPSYNVGLPYTMDGIFGWTGGDGPSVLVIPQGGTPTPVGLGKDVDEVQIGEFLTTDGSGELQFSQPNWTQLGGSQDDVPLSGFDNDLETESITIITEIEVDENGAVTGVTTSQYTVVKGAVE